MAACRQIAFQFCFAQRHRAAVPILFKISKARLANYVNCLLYFSVNVGGVDMIVYFYNHGFVVHGSLETDSRGDVAGDIRQTDIILWEEFR